MTKKRYLVTSALPYANGPLHYGHLAGVYIPSDIYVRHLKLKKEKVIHISGSDEHGVAIMLNAKKANRPYKEYVDSWHQEHKKIFALHQIEFDFFGQTSADYHAKETIKWFHSLNSKGLIGTKIEKQLYHEFCKNYLPDRFVEGTCYECGYANARGDECPNCGALIDSIRLKNPVCKICGGKDNIKIVDSTQYFILLSKFHTEYRKWLDTKKDNWRKTVGPYVDSLTAEGLHDRAITRDIDWGIDVPLADTKGKKLYVWFDAPIGYVSNTKEYLKSINSKEDYKKDWWQNLETEIVNFLGKDNIIFHAIIFPVMSMASGEAHAVDDIPANQYLNLVGKQFSKSQGHYVDANEAIKEFGPDAIRYYLISIMPENADSSFTWEDFAAKVNGELANNIGNLFSRCLKFFIKQWPDGLEENFFQTFLKGDLALGFTKSFGDMKNALDSKNFRRALEEIMKFGLQVNHTFTLKAPWSSIKTDKDQAANTIASTSVAILLLGIMFRPFLPGLSEKMLAPYKHLLSDEEVKDFYSDKDIEAAISKLIKKVFSGTFRPGVLPDMLVPKIDDKRIAELSQQLAGK